MRTLGPLVLLLAACQSTLPKDTGSLHGDTGPTTTPRDTAQPDPDSANPADTADSGGGPPGDTASGDTAAPLDTASPSDTGGVLSWETFNLELEGHAAIYLHPAAPRGVIVLLHGAGGSCESWLDSTEQLRFTDYALASGFALLAPESTDRETGMWNTEWENNQDIALVQGWLDLLAAQGYRVAADPVFSVGMSVGAGFSSVLSQVAGFTANAMYLGPGQSIIYATDHYTPPPTLFVCAENDSQVDNATILYNYESALARGHAVELRVKREEALRPDRMSRIEDLSESDSQAIFDLLCGAGRVDENGFLSADPSNDEGLAALLVGAGWGFWMHEIVVQLEVVYAEHAFMSDFREDTVAMFEARLDR